VAAVVVGIAAGSAFLTWLPVVLAGAVLLTSAIQLALRRKEGLVTRMIVSIGGALVILAVTSLVLVLVHPAVTFAGA
jgi:hypothetical protein